MPRIFNDNPSEIQPARLGRRLAAMSYDLLIVAAIWMLVGGAAVAINNGEAVDSPLGSAALKSALFVATYLFFAYSWTRTGQTIGMLAWRIRIQKMDNRTLTWTESLIRFFAAGFSMLCLGIGYWVMLFGDERLTWHDRWTESTVVYLPKKKKI